MCQMYSSLQTRQLISQYFYNFINGFFMMRQIPQIWYVIKMSLGVFITVAITFAWSYLIRGEKHTFWFPYFDQTVYLSFTSWTIITLGSYVMVFFLAYYGFSIITYFYQRRKNKL